MTADVEAQKQAAAEAAIAEVRPGMLVGLGTGTTAAYAIAALGQRVKAGLDIKAVTTSQQTRAVAQAARIPLVEMDAYAAIDLAIDGVDEIDPAFRAIKGAGGAMLREKVVAAAAKRMVAIADSSKAVDRLGARPIPIEVLPLALAFVTSEVAKLGATAALRLAVIPVRTDQGNIILDCAFPSIDDPAALAAALSAIPGLLGHGLFLAEIDALYLGTATGVERREAAGGR